MASGQSPAPVQAPPLPTASEVIARYVRAIGGREAMQRHESIRAVGTFSMPAQGITGTVERVAARPDRFREKVSMFGVGEMQLGFDGSIGWMVTPMTGPMVPTGRQLEQLRHDAEFDAALHDPAGFTALEIVDRIEFEGRPAYKLRALRTNGDEDFEFYDVDSGLLVGSIVSRESPLGTMKATNVMSDYRGFSGVQIPTRQVQRVLGTEQVVTITTVEFGGVDPSMFAPPASIRALAK